MQDAGARRVGNAEGMRGIVRKHDCALPAQYTKHSNARGHSFRYYRVLSKALLGFSVPDKQPSMTAHQCQSYGGSSICVQFGSDYYG